MMISLELTEICAHDMDTHLEITHFHSFIPKGQDQGSIVYTPTFRLFTSHVITPFCNAVSDPLFSPESRQIIIETCIGSILWNVIRLYAFTFYIFNLTSLQES